ncbi:MAG: HNH endonuclease [Rhodococcus sp.]|nr:HNH endonuclease [Rhodococcus sp. (in: high G+C Gram-positive bacteria)]
MKHTKEKLEEAVRASVNFADVVRYLGLKPNGGNHTHIARRIRALGIDTSHFTGRARVAGGNAVKRHWTSILRDTAEGSARTKPHLLRRALIESGRPHVCAGCGLEPIWCGKPLVFHVDHVDGNPTDSRPENVRFLCPNCHSQTATWAGRRRFRVDSDTSA